MVRARRVKDLCLTQWSTASPVVLGHYSIHSSAEETVLVEQTIMKPNARLILIHTMHYSGII